STILSYRPASLFFYILPRQTPSSTPFPYTTLFRSQSFFDAAPPPAELLEAAEFRRTLGMFATGVTVITTRVGGQVHGMTANANIDRKSTRLNSSHRTISYAVFCLKKKNN